MQITAALAYYMLGYFCSLAKTAPVHSKYGWVDSVIVSVDQFEAMKASGERKYMAQRQKEFNDSIQDWIALQDDHFVKNSLWCDGMAPQMERHVFAPKSSLLAEAPYQ